jgi:signal transduction histidine kinase
MTDPFAKAIFTIANAFTLAVMLTLAIVVQRQGPRTTYLRAWFFFCICIGLYALSLILGANLSSPSMGLIAIRLAMTFGSLALLALLEFLFSYVGGVPGVRFFTGGHIVWVGILLVLFWATDLIVAGVVPSQYSRSAPVLGPLAPLYLAFVIYGWVLSMTLSIQAFRRSTGLKRTQATYLLAAQALLFIATTGSFVPNITKSQTLLAILPALLLPLLPLSITYAIVRHRLWDIRTIFHKTAIWAILTLGLVLPLYGVLRLGVALNVSLGNADVAALLTLLFLVGYKYLQQVRPRLDHWFGRRAFDRRVVLERLAKEMVALGRPKDVAQKLLGTLHGTLYPQSAVVLLPQEREGPQEWQPERSEPWRVIAQPDGHPGGTFGPFNPEDRFFQLLTELKTAVDRSQLEVDRRFEPVLHQAEDHFEATRAQVCLPLVQGERLIGLIYLGEKENLRPYSRGDLEFLDQLGVEASIGLANAQLFSRVDLQREALESLTDSLEQRVEERTGELETTNLQLTAANEELKALDRLKSRLFGNISHELRTPLTLILAPLDSMIAGGLGSFDQEQREHLTRIKRSSLELLRRIDDLLDLAQLEEAHVRLTIRAFNVHDLLSRIVDYAVPLAERKEIEVSLVCEVHPTIEADEEKLERVVVNLLTNALKFTEPGGRVQLRLGMVKMEGEGEGEGDGDGDGDGDGNGDSGGRIVIAVEDTGMGIPAEELNQIFGRFQQTELSSSQQRGGVGLGLAIVKEIIELHDGCLRVTSEPEKGSTFFVEIPKSAAGLDPERIERRVEVLSVPVKRRDSDQGLRAWSQELQTRPEYRFLGLEAATERRVVPRSPLGNLQSLRLLVVDDNTEILQYLHQVLSHQYDIWALQQGERAWELLLQERHDLVIADIMMPGLTGLDLCRRIKADPRTQSVPVILLTARVAVEQRVEGRRAGADAYLTKPFEPQELLAVIGNLLEGKARGQEIAARRRSASLETLLAGLAHELGNATHQLRNAHRVILMLARQELAGQVARPEPEEAEPEGAPHAEAPHAEATDDEGGQDLTAHRMERMEGISLRALDRISRVVQSLRQYARQMLQIPWSNHDFDRLVAREVQLLAADEEQGVTLTLSLESESTVRGPEEELRQMVLNLVENAIQAVSPGGEVVVETREMSGKVQLTVTDNGIGIPPEVLNRVFDPFFTTKESGASMGLGLALCERITSDLGGAIDIKSRQGKGTVVAVDLPTAQQSDQADSPETQGAEDRALKEGTDHVPN